MNELNKYIKAELNKRRQLYISQPTYILEHYNTEKQNIEAYNGRQLLEMLQNADDAAESTDNKRVLISLYDNELIIANNGESFTVDGLRSILYISVSPKTKKKNKIGHKGLGFRSILSWADEICISSGGMNISFAKSHAEKFLQDLIKDRNDIAAFLSERVEEKNPIAILRVPKLMGFQNKSQLEFDTIISVKLKPESLDDVQKQIERVISKETLVFLNNTDLIEIRSPKKNVDYKREIRDDGSIIVTSKNHSDDTEVAQKWNVVREAGEHNGKCYELAIAWTDKLADKENFIYSYFKTNVKFPFPALVHGTFELSQDRNHLEKDTSGHNEFLTSKLADLLIKTALNVGTASGVGYLPLKLLNIDFENIDAILQEYRFKDKLFGKIKQSKVFPTVNRSYICYDQKPVFYDYPIAKVLSGDDVDNLMPPCDDASVVNFLQDIMLFYFNLRKYFTIISRRAIHLRTNELAEVIYHLLNYNYYVKEIESPDFDLSQYPPILVDMDGGLIDADSNVFVQPSGGSDLTLPEFLKIRLLHPALFNELSKLFANTGRDKLMQKLGNLGIKEYSFETISETLVEYYQEKPRLKIADILQLHSHLFKLFRREAKEKELTKFKITSTPVISQKLEIVTASNIYFGKAYDNELAESLYSFNKNKILAGPENYKLPAHSHEMLIKYFKWLGVEEFPRYHYLTFKVGTSHPYVDYLLRSLKYPHSSWGYSFKNFNELNGWLPGLLDVKVATFDDIEKILHRAKVPLIMRWIDKDTRLKDTLEKDRETATESNLHFFRNTDRAFVNHYMISYTKWVISRMTFMPVLGSNHKAAPNECCLSKTITEEFSPFVEKPKISISTVANKLCLNEDAVLGYLTLMGVHREISSFSVAALYEVLNSLPLADKEGNAAKKIYREIINNFSEGKIDVNHPEYKRFISSGKILARKGGIVDYFPVSESYYLPTKAYGSNVLKRFSLADIDSKQGAQKIEKLFGVKRLKDLSFSVESALTLSGLNDEFNDDLERFKALVYVLRKDKDTGREIAGRLRRLKIQLVVGLEPVFIYKGTSEKFLLEEFEYVNTRKRNEFYISVSPDVLLLEEIRGSNKFCQSISEIFSTLIETEEYNDFIHDLYSKNQGGRELRLLSYIQKDDSHDIEESKQLLNIVDDIRFSFWRAIYYAKNLKGALETKKGVSLEDLLIKKLRLAPKVIDLFSKEVLAEINDLSNLQTVYTLFLEHNVDYNIFSRHFFSLDFQPFFRDKIEDLKLEFKERFYNGLFLSMEKADTTKKEKYFEKVDSYNRFSYSKEAGFIKNILSYFSEYISANFSFDIKMIEHGLKVEDRLSQTLSILLSQAVVVPTELKQKKDFQSLLLFQEYDEIKRRVDNFQRSTNNSSSIVSRRQVKVGNRTFDFDDFENLAIQLLANIDFDNVGIKQTKTVAVSASDSAGVRKQGKNNTRKVYFDKSSEEVVGFISELICYQTLIGKYGEENVNWISENANKAFPGRFLTKEAGSGYDLEITENGKVRFLEIKGMSDVTKGIHISNEEIRVAMEFSDRYDLMIVEAPLSVYPVIRHIRSAFKFKKDETLFNNDKMKVLNDNYIIKIRWK